MHYWYDIDVELGCVFIKRIGPYAHDKWVAALRLINNDARLRRGMNRIYDLREAEGTATADQIRDLVQEFEQLDNTLGPRKVAFITPQPVIFGMNRMYALLRDDTVAVFQVYKTYDEAKDWIGLPTEFEDPFPSFEELKEAD